MFAGTSDRVLACSIATANCCCRNVFKILKLISTCEVVVAHIVVYYLFAVVLNFCEQLWPM